MSTASESTGADAGWDAFVTQPALYIEPSRLAVCFDGMVDSELCARLKSSLRLEERLSGLVHSRYGLAHTIAAEDVSDTDRSIALASSEQLAELVRRAGAIYWANSIANTVRAADAAAFDAALGESAVRRRARQSRSFRPDAAAHTLRSARCACDGRWLALPWRMVQGAEPRCRPARSASSLRPILLSTMR